MLKITIDNTQYDNIIIECMGHTGFAKAGEDIVCAAASILFINTVNSIEKFTDSSIEVDESKDLVVSRISNINEKTKVLLDSFILGIESIREEYGKEYLSLKFKEV